MSLYTPLWSPKDRVNNTPMRSIGELAEELGISMAVLRSLIYRKNGPKSLMTGFSKVKRPYYNRAEILRWYATLKEQGIVKNAPPR